MARLTNSDGKIILDGTLTYNEKVRLALEKLKRYEDLEDLFYTDELTEEEFTLIDVSRKGIYEFREKYLFNDKRKAGYEIKFESAFYHYVDICIDFEEKELFQLSELRDERGYYCEVYEKTTWKLKDINKTWFTTKEELIEFVRQNYPHIEITETGFRWK